MKDFHIFILSKSDSSFGHNVYDWIRHCYIKNIIVYDRNMTIKYLCVNNDQLT